MSPFKYNSGNNLLMTKCSLFSVYPISIGALGPNPTNFISKLIFVSSGEPILPFLFQRTTFKGNKFAHYKQSLPF